MQLHPSDPERAVAHATRSLGLGYIGLDFRNPPGDLMVVEPESVDSNQRNYLDLAHTMAVDDLVLVMAHHYPHALVRVKGEYNYIREPEEELGVWFRHFRRVEILGYYSDFEKNPENWISITMPATIGVLNTPESESFRLIERWRKEVDS